MSKSVLITGGSGFLGSALCSLLVEGGSHIAVVDRRSPQWLERLAALGQATHHPLRASEMTEMRWEDGQNPPQTIFHLEWSGSIREAAASPSERARASFDSLHASLSWASALRVPFVFASSAQVYSGALNRPVREEDDDPATFFGAHKRGAEAIVRAWSQSEGLPSASLRLFSLYGPASLPQMILPRLLDAAATGQTVQVFGDGSQRRDYVSTRDAAEAFLAASQVPSLRGEALNIGSGRSWSIMELIQLVEAVTGRSLVLEHKPKSAQDIALLQADSSRAEALLGWRAGTRLEEALGELWEARLKG